MILHLVNDEKIINRTVRLFESAAPENICLLFLPPQKGLNMSPLLLR